MKEEEIRVVFWHNDFNDGLRSHNYFGKDGPIHKRVLANIGSGILKWHFHGGFIHPERGNLLKRLKIANVLIAAYPWNMDMDDAHMHYPEAAESLLEILKAIKKENKKLKIFFFHPPACLGEEFKKIAEIVEDIHADAIYNYFLEK